MKKIIFLASICLALNIGCNPVGQSSLGSISQDSTGTPAPAPAPAPAPVPVAQTIKLEANATDNVGVTKVEFHINGQFVCTASKSADSKYGCDWTVPDTRGVKYDIVAKAYDANNNPGTSQTVSVYTEN
jgi:hypothetical protein